MYNKLRKNIFSMKTLQYSMTLAAALLAAAMFISCKGGKTAEETADAAADTLGVSKAGYLSSDLAFFGLKGQVKTLTESQKLLGEYGEGVDPEITVYQFDENGTLLTVNDADPFTKAIDEDSGTASWWERDSNGNISATDIFTMSLDQEPIGGNHYTWANGIVTGETQTSFFEGQIVTKLTYSYDNQGNLLSKNGTMSCTGMDDQQIYHMYEYKGSDKNGNWLTCLETSNDTGETGEATFQYSTTREIIYY